MNKIKQSIIEILQRSSDTIRRFPATIALALGFTLVTFIRIYLDFPKQISYNYLLTCLHLSMGAGMFLSLMFISWTGTAHKREKFFNHANAASLIATSAIFILLYFFGASMESVDSGLGVRVSELSGARIASLIAISILWFIYCLSISSKSLSYPKALFIFQKSLVIAIIYGLAILIGTTGVAGAVQALLYRGMSSKVYMYISALSSLMGFILFVSYFPETGEKSDYDRWEEAHRQPKFISLLFGGILIPVISLLTVVLVVWIGKTIITSSWPEFGRLSSITTSYMLTGLWLYFMTSHMETEISKKYRFAFPYSALLIMAFQLVALVRQLSLHGLKYEEYGFGLVLLFGIGSSIIILTRHKNLYVKIISLLSFLIVFNVLPYFGYYSAPVIYQLNRLENVLIENQMLVDDVIVKGENIGDNSKIIITDTVEFLSFTRDYHLPEWFSRSYGYDSEFSDVFGFEKLRSEDEDIDKPYDNKTIGIFLQLSSEPISIEDYTWVVFPNYSESRDGSLNAEIVGEQGKYTFKWNDGTGYDIPKVQLLKDGNLIYEESIKEFTDKIISKHKNGTSTTIANVEDMQINIETEHVDVKILFGNISINVDPVNDEISRWFEIKSVYFKEK